MPYEPQWTPESRKPAVTGTILVTPRLALPMQLIEIKFIARVRCTLKRDGYTVAIVQNPNVAGG